MTYALAFALTFVISALMTPFVRFWAIRHDVVDRPTSERKIHLKPIPLLGGAAVFSAFAIGVLFYWIFTDRLVTGYLEPWQVGGILIGGLILMVGGYYDDKYNLPPNRSIIAPVIAAVVVILCGVGIKGFSNPFGGTVHMDQLVNEFASPILFYTVRAAGIFITFVWLMGMMYTTKYMDGLDGLVSGIGLIAAIIIFVVSQNPTLQQDYMALFAILFAGALAGFLLYNFYPASIFIGEGGSLFVGFVIGSLAIISGTKIATALLVMGVPIFDVAWVIARRLVTGKKITMADKHHLHHRLLNVGLSHRNAVLSIYALTIMFGITAIFLQTIYKLYVLAGLGVFMVLFGMLLVYVTRRKINLRA